MSKHLINSQQKRVQLTLNSPESQEV